MNVQKIWWMALFLMVPLRLVSPAQAAPPNVVILLSDDQAWTDFSFMGHPHIRTPHLDQLAEESLTFTRGYVPDSLCRPSLMTLITGRYAHDHGITGNDPVPPPELQKLPRGKMRAHPEYQQLLQRFISHIDDEQTLPALLKQQLGYQSLQTGKWWEGNYRRGGFTAGMSSGDPKHGGRHGDEGLDVGRKTMEPVYDFIRSAKSAGEPFFVWYAPMMPHSPHTPPDRILDHYRDKTPHLAVAKYWAMCEWYDETVGQLLHFLDEQSLSDNTIVISLCDNGWINDEQADRYAPRSKRSPYDGGLRTPITIRWPGHVSPRFDREHPVSEIDIVPTVLAAVGAHGRPDLPGINLLDDKAVKNRQAIFGEILEHDVVDIDQPVRSLMFRWIVSGDWKLIIPNSEREPQASVELFRITSDPNEATNLAAQNPDVVAELQAQLNAWWPEAAP